MNPKSLITFILITLGVLLGVGGVLWQFGSNAGKPIADVAGDMRHTRGSGEITLVEFSDFQCPACQAVQQPLKQILSKYEGKVTFVYRHFPLITIHKNAQIAALASEAAHAQGKFWEWHDLLFEKQTEWGSADDPTQDFMAYAVLLEMDTEKFIADMESQEAKDAVSLDLLFTTQNRLTGTPTFFLNGSKIEFNQIEARLAELTSQAVSE